MMIYKKKSHTNNQLNICNQLEKNQENCLLQLCGGGIKTTRIIKAGSS
jgi:hypothetical protein